MTIHKEKKIIRIRQLTIHKENNQNPTLLPKTLFSSNCVSGQRQHKRFPMLGNKYNYQYYHHKRLKGFPSNVGQYVALYWLSGSIPYLARLTWIYLTKFQQIQRRNETNTYTNETCMIQIRIHIQMRKDTNANANTNEK